MTLECINKLKKLKNLHMIFYLKINSFLKNNFKIIIKRFNKLLNYKSIAEKKTKDIRSKLTLGLINILKKLKNLSITSYAQVNFFFKNHVKTVLISLLLLLLVWIIPIEYLPMLLLLLFLINIINFYIFILHYILKKRKNLSITSYAQFNFFFKNHIKTVLISLLLLLLVWIIPIEYLPILLLLLYLIDIINFYIFVLHYILKNPFKRKKTKILINVIEISNKKT